MALRASRIDPIHQHLAPLRHVRQYLALFIDTLPVNSYQFRDLSNNRVLSYDTTAVASLVQKLYAKLARSADGNMPHVSDIADDGDWSALVDAVRQIDRSFMNRETGLRDPRAHFSWFFDLQRRRPNREGAIDMVETLALL